MIKILMLFITLFSSLSSASTCDGLSVYDTATGLYSADCAALFLNMTPNDYSHQMALVGSFTGFIFMLLSLWAVFLIGKKST